MFSKPLKALIVTPLFLLAPTLTLALKTLPVPPTLIPMNSKKGIHLFNRTHYKRAFFALSPFFVTEKGLAFCGIASSTMVLNALLSKAPLTPQHAPYRIFTQNNIFTGPVLTITTPAKVYSKGATLAQTGKIIQSFGTTVKTIYGSTISLSQFRKDALAAVNSNHSFIIINFCRHDIQEKGCGHFSPLAAYDKKNDRFLLLDVARYKYPSVWVKTPGLYKAIRTGTDSASHKSRGYLLVSAP